MIRIAVDGRALEEREGTGVARYLRNILREWDRTLSSDVEVWCYTRRMVEDNARFRQLHWRIVPGGRLGRRGLVWQNAVFPRAAAGDGASLLWAPFNLTPLAAGLPVAVTIHDVSFIANPAWFSRHERRLWPALARLSVHRAGLVLTDSHFSREEIVRRLDVDPASIVVAPLAADPSFGPADAGAVAELHAKLGLDRPYVLYLGALFARRNILPLLDAFRWIGREQQSWQLVLAGPNRYHPPLDLEAAVEGRGLAGRVRHLPYVDESDLRALYTGALVFVYPSSYEGFGLPVIEAMSCGVPVVTGDAASLPEVANDAALLVDPTAPRALGAALFLAGTQPALRAELRRRGLAQAATFSWAHTARLTLDALTALAGRKQGSEGERIARDR